MAANANCVEAASVPGPNLNEKTASAAAPRNSYHHLWKMDSFREIEERVGKQRAGAYLERYLSKLEEVSAQLLHSETSTSSIREAAHNMKSMSGQLGFEALSTLSALIMMQPNGDAIRASMIGWLHLIQASSDAVRLYTRQGGVGPVEGGNAFSPGQPLRFG